MPRLTCGERLQGVGGGWNLHLPRKLSRANVSIRINLNFGLLPATGDSDSFPLLLGRSPQIFFVASSGREENIIKSQLCAQDGWPLCARVEVP